MINQLFCRRLSLVLIALAIVVSLPSWAQAHVAGGHENGFLAGLSHPITGLDHIVAMLAVGVWAAQRGGRSLWLVPLTFVGVMALGGVLGAAGFALPGVERWIVASVLVLGVLIAAAVRMPLAAATLLVGLFAFFHGHAHGAEMPDAANALVFGLGFTLMTAVLHLLGIGVGVGLQRYGGRYGSGSVQWVRFAGAAVTACGLYLCL